MQYIIQTWNDEKVETIETVYYSNQLDEILNVAVETKQLNPDLVVKIFEREHADSFLIKHVTTIELSEEQKLQDYWNHSIIGVLKNKQIKTV